MAHDSTWHTIRKHVRQGRRRNPLPENSNEAPDRADIPDPAAAAPPAATAEAHAVDDLSEEELSASFETL